MVHSEKKYVASTIEALSLYVDLAERKVAEFEKEKVQIMDDYICLLYTSPSPRDSRVSRMPSSA